MRAQLTYPFAKPPEHGKPKEVADGVYWLRMPLPFALDHINLYLLRDGDGWIIVDTGIRGAQTLEHWERVIDDFFGAQPIKRVLVTHMHPDHAGQAGWLTRHFGVDLWMTRTEYLMCRLLAEDGPADVPEDAISFYRSAGFRQRALDLYQQRFGRFGQMIERLPAGYRRLRDRERLAIDGREWEVVVGRGHSPEHACLYSADHGVLISGDQVLPRISSNVSVFPTEPQANPLRDWIESCLELKCHLPADLLVLPSHNEPFKGLHARLEELVTEHYDNLESLHAYCAEPKQVVEVFPALFRREIDGGTLLLATGESIAHLNYLIETGAMVRESAPDGVDRYVRSGDFQRPA
ncbi:MAG: MBL fold metallo-hydrolase [Gammaproteobacteria bacterium]